MSRSGAERLNMVQLAIFSSPVLVFQALELPWRVFLPVFFSETLGLQLAAVAALMMWIRLFDMVVDPVVGWASDRFATPIGLRRPWMVASVPLILLGTWQTFFAAPGIGLWTLALWCLAMHLGYTLLLVPHGGWGLEVSGDYHERTRIMGAKVWFAAAGMPFVLLLPTILEYFGRDGRAGQVAAMGWMLILITPLSVALVLRYIPEPPVDRDAARRTAHPLRQFRTMLRDRTLLTILMLYALLGLADAASAGTFIFFVEQGLALGRGASGLMLIQALVALVSIPVWAAVSRRFGKRRALAGVFAWHAALSPVALLLPAGEMVPLVLFLIVRNFSWGADYMLLRALVADVSGRDAEVSGERKSGSYYAMFNVTLKLAAALGVGAALSVLAWKGFVPGSPATGAVVTAIRWVYALPPCLAGLLGLVILMRATPETAVPAATPVAPREAIS
ncbi:MFS transporter [Sphingomonas psychrotolerans]|nr:MFS transporter [Sphingomonas psychrotolerans]